MAADNSKQVFALETCTQCPQEKDLTVISQLKDILPTGFRHLVCSCTSTSDNSGHFEAVIRVNLRSTEDVENWKTDFCDSSKTTLRIKKTYPALSTIVVYKVEYKCQHNTYPRSTTANKRRNSKNTDCPASVTLTLYKSDICYSDGYKRKSRSHDCHRQELPAQLHIKYCHNHPINAASTLKFRDVSGEARLRLEQLILQGYAPGAALELFKYDLQIEHGDDYVYVCGDRAVCPDRDYVYKLYYKLCKERYGDCHGTTQVPQLREFVNSLEMRMQKENCEETMLIEQPTPTNSTDIEASNLFTPQHLNTKYIEMDVTEDSQIIVVVCTPLMHRVHKLVKHSEEMVFIDATGNVDRNHCRVFLMLTHSCVGGLPLGVIITTNESQQTIKRGLELLVIMLGKDGFGGRGQRGPIIFMTDDSKAERNAIKDVFPESISLLCVFHVLQAFWRYLWDSKNGVPRLERPVLFALLKEMVYASSEQDLNTKFMQATANDTVQKHLKVLDYIKGLFHRRKQWAVCYRADLLVRGNHTNNFVKTTNFKPY